MLKNISFLVILCCLVTFAYAQEEITITTYYPSPFGSYRELETETLFFRETTNGLISFNDVNNDNIYNRRLRITAGESDTQDNDQGASIDLHGNAAGGRLDLVAGRGGYTSFWTSPAGTPEAERVRITAAGNVGIGTTNPTITLEIQAATPGLRIRPTPTSNNSDANIFLYTTQTAADREWRIMAGTGGGSPNTNFRIYDNTAAADRLNINSAGNVGIGTASPQAKLHVGGTAGTDGIKFPDGSLQTRATNIYSDIRDTYIETTSDVNWTDLASINLPADFSGGKAYITFTAPIAKKGAFKVRLTLDGNSLTATPSIDLAPGFGYLAGAIRGAPVTLTYVLTNLAAGAHTIKAQWRGDTIAGPNPGGGAYAIIEANSARVLTVITGQ